MNNNFDSSLTPVKRWEDLSFWEKLNDKDPSRPPKTLGNIFFWSWPINSYKTMLSSDAPRFDKGTFPFLTGDKPCHIVRLSQFKGKTYGNEPLSHGVKLVWVGWFWGWK